MRRATTRTLHQATCRDTHCDYCQTLAEDRSYDWGFADDWQKSQDQFERHLDRMGGNS